MTIFSVSQSFGGKALIDPSPLASDLQTAGYAVDHFLGKANSFTLPIGFKAGLGYILLEKSDLDSLGIDGATHSLILTGGNVPVEIKKLVILDSEVVDGSDTTTSRSVCLVRITDIRAIGRLSSIDKIYNVQDPTFNGTSYYKRSLNGSTPWTWETMIQDIWDNLPPDFGALDTDNAAFPTTKPDGFDFQGWDAWTALESALKSIERSIQLSPDGTFSVIIPGATGNGAQFTSLANFLVDHGHNAGNAAVYLPATIKVFFPNKTYAWHESTDPSEAVGKSYWRNRAFYSYEILTEGDNVFPGTKLSLHSSMYAIYDDSESKTLTNSSQLRLEAIRMAADYTTTATSDEVEMTFSGFHPIAFNGDVTSVAWYDFGNEPGVPQGAFTTITRFPRSPRIDITVSGRHKKTPLYFSPENYPGPADLATQHLDVEYLAIVKPTVDIPPLKAGRGEFQYGKSTGVDDFTTWHSSALPHWQIFHNFTTKTIAAEENYLAVWIQQRKKWVIVPNGTGGASLTLLQARDWMQVGGAVAVNIWRNNAGAWEQSTIGEGEEIEPQTAIAQDILHRSFLAPGDLVWGHQIGTTADGFAIYEILGESGLSQTGPSIGDVECGAEGTFQVTVANPNKQPTQQNETFDQTGDEYLASRKTKYSQPDCPVAYQAESVIACKAVGGCSRKIFMGEYVSLRYITANRKWEFKAIPDTLLVRCKLASDMCPNDLTANLTEIIPEGCCGEPPFEISTGVGLNTFKLSGRAGYNAFAVHIGTGNNFRLLQVQHKETEIVEQLEIDESETCPSLLKGVRKFSLMSCVQNPEVSPLLSFGEVTVVTGIQASGCDLTVARVKVCVAGGSAASDQTVTLSTVEVDVITGLGLDDSGAGESSVQDTLCRVLASTRTIKVCAAAEEIPGLVVLEFQSQIVVYNIVDTGTDILACYVEIFTPCIGDTFCEPVIETEICTTSSSPSS